MARCLCFKLVFPFKKLPWVLSDWVITLQFQNLFLKLQIRLLCHHTYLLMQLETSSRLGNALSDVAFHKIKICYSYIVQQDMWIEIQSLSVQTVHQVPLFFVMFKMCGFTGYFAIDLVILQMAMNICSWNIRKLRYKAGKHCLHLLTSMHIFWTTDYLAFILGIVQKEWILTM